MGSTGLDGFYAPFAGETQASCSHSKFGSGAWSQLEAIRAWWQKSSPDRTPNEGASARLGENPFDQSFLEARFLVWGDLKGPPKEISSILVGFSYVGTRI